MNLGPCSENSPLGMALSPQHEHQNPTTGISIPSQKLAYKNGTFTPKIEPCALGAEIALDSKPFLSEQALNLGKLSSQQLIQTLLVLFL